MTTPTITDIIAAKARNAQLAAAQTQSTIATGTASTAPDTPAQPQPDIAADIPDEEFYKGLAKLYDKPAYLLKGIKQIVGKGGVITKPDLNSVIATEDAYLVKMLDYLATTTGYVFKLPQEKKE
jgi:hypothetical protein